MNRYLSAVGLYARWNLYKILAIILVTALAAGALVYRVPVGDVPVDMGLDPETGETMQAFAYYDRLDGVIAESRAPIVCAAGFAAIVAVMSLTGCGYNTKAGYTVRRLRVKEETAVLLWGGYHAVLLVIFWAILAAVLYGVMTLRLGMEVTTDHIHYGPQSMMLLCYTDTFLHHLLPLQDVAAWGVGIASVLAAALSTVLFSYRQRRGSFSVMVLLALAGTIGSFFCGLGENANALLMVLLLGVAGAAFVMLIGGDKDAA